MVERVGAGEIDDGDTRVLVGEDCLRFFNRYAAKVAYF